jgi:hypothetical protein
MRTLMKVKIATAAGNEAIKSGSLPEIVRAFDAQITSAPVMNADDRRAGVGRAMEAA